jgi:hypothetical protein
MDDYVGLHAVKQKTPSNEGVFIFKLKSILFWKTCKY